MSGEEARNLLGVERAPGDREVVNSAVRAQSKCEPHVSELEVQIDDHG